jgi:hypothetical protein
MFRQIHNRPSLLERMTASLAIALVLCLTVLAASPDLHERLHGHHSEAASAEHHDGLPAKADTDDGCVVTLFSHGIALALGLLALAFTGKILRLCDFADFDRAVPESPRYLLLPTQAPPSA